MLEFILKPWHLVVLFLASHLTREQQRVIEYLQVENQVLREKLGNEYLWFRSNCNQPAALNLATGQLAKPPKGIHWSRSYPLGTTVSGADWQ